MSKALRGERELAFGMAYHSLRAARCADNRADNVIAALRGGGRMPTQEFASIMPPAAATSGRERVG